LELERALAQIEKLDQQVHLEEVRFRLLGAAIV
jgi:hypothetical protein